MNSVAIRLLGYLLVLGLLIGTPVFMQLNAPGSLRLLVASEMATTLGTSEYSIVEWLQCLVLLVIIVLAALSVRWQSDHPAVSMMTLALALIACVRELDLFLDYYVVDHAWQVLVGLILVAMVVYLSQNWASFRLAWVRCQPSIGLALILAALAILLVFVSLFGHEPFWQSVSGDAYQRTIKIAVEELSELAGYWLWLIGQCEYLVQCARLHRIQTAGDRRTVDRRR